MAVALHLRRPRVNDRISEVARDIMRYLVEHRESADTLEGIARWRLAQQTVERAVDETAAALRMLTERGLVDEVRTGVGPTVFRLKSTSESALNDLLAQNGADRR